MSGSGEKAIFFSPRRLTPTERRILLYVARHNGKACSKGEIAQELGRNKKTVDRLVARLRADGLLESEAVWDENGGQRANMYRLAHGGGGLVVQVME